MAFVRKTSGSRGPKFVTSKGGSSVRVSPGKGGVNVGTPTHCTAKRAAPNVRYGYR